MKTAICTVCMPELSWREAFAQAALAGYKDVELLMIPKWVHLTPGTVPPAEVLAEAARAGIRLVALHAGGMDGSTDENLQSSCQYISAVISEAKKLGVKLVVFTGYTTPAGATAETRAQILGRIATGLENLGPQLQLCGVKIGLENHYQCQIETLADYQAVFKQLGNRAPNIGVTLDTGHFTASGIDPAAIAKALGKRIIHVHIKDHIGTESKGLGYGKTDNAAVVRELKKNGYTGWLSVEMEVHDRENAPRYVRESFGYMQKLAANKTA